MIIISCIGIIALFLTGIIIYKITKKEKIKSFFKSEEFFTVLKDFLIVLLGVTLALNFTSLADNKNTKETVVKLLEVAQNDMNRTYTYNTTFIDGYEAGILDAESIKDSVINNTSTEVIENILKNDTVITTISPRLFAMLVNNVNSFQYFYAKLFEDIGEEEIIDAIKCMNTHCEDIFYAIDLEIQHLNGDYSDKEIENLVNEYVLNKYANIEIH